MADHRDGIEQFVGIAKEPLVLRIDDRVTAFISPAPNQSHQFHGWTWRHGARRQRRQRHLNLVAPPVLGTVECLIGRPQQTLGVLVQVLTLNRNTNADGYPATG